MTTNARSRVALPPNFMENDPEWKRKSSLWMLEANQGRINNVGEVTFASGTVSTVVVDMRVGQFSFIGLMPITANAAAETPYITTSAEAFTITHANAATGDRTFRYAILG